MFHRKLLLILCILIIPQPVFCQYRSVFDSLSKALLTAKLPADKVRVLIALSREEEGSDPSKSIQYAQNALNISEKNEMETETIRSLIQLGNSYIRVSKYQNAFEVAQKAIEMSGDRNKPEEMAKARGIMALIYYELGDYEQSARYDFENLKYYEEINNQKQIGISLGNIGIDFTSQNNYQKGLEYLNKSFEIAKKNNDYHGMAYQYNNIAGVYSEYYRDHRIALGYYKEALKINSKLNDSRQQGIYLMNIGNSFSKLKMNDSILGYYEKAREIFRSINNQYLLAECQTHIGEYYYTGNVLTESLLNADSALILSLQNDFKEKIKTAAGLLHKIYLSRNDTLRAYRYAMLENQAKDSLVEKQNRQEVYKLEFQYNYEKQDKAKQIARQRKDNLMVVIILSLASGLIIIILLFSRNRIKSKNIVLEKESIEKELHFKDKELTINLIALIKKNEMLSDISNKLIQIGKGAKNEETKEAIHKITREVRNNADDKMLKEFSLRFQEVHTGFYESLLKKYPDLTQNELKLCAFLRLNMSSKDISELTGQRILTIDHARYRLRKKLGISNLEVNLVAFLSQI
ncbi:MAG: tetratricopeptide repeat protein [Lentimicrobium sp.]